uniref:Putative cytochrome P450 6a14 n=2 Tax=Lygus hesperus TaxID=30085 RepID=A0A146L945_LYGHE
MYVPTLCNTTCRKKHILHFWYIYSKTTMILEISLFFASLAVLYFYLMSHYNFWDKTCVPALKPKYPFFGNTVDVLFSLKDVMTIQKDIYNAFPNQRFVGLFTFTRPNLFVRDPAMIEQITIKDFPFASDRGISDDPRATPLSMHLINTRNDHWRSLRNKLTPTFTSGKLKGMHGQLLDCADSLVEHMKTIESAETFEARDLMACFTTDVIASCAFGLNIDTLTDRNSLFRAFGKATFNFSPTRKIFRTIRRLLGPLARFISLPGGIKPKLIEFFIKAVDDTVEYRKKNGVVRQDFLHLMNELVEKEREMVSNGQMDPNDPHMFDHATLVSNAFVFFVAGFETTATTISYALYELALNQQIQEDLHKEIVTVSAKHNGKLTFEAFQDMKYLDQVISETLRLYPPVPALTRKVTKDYRVPHTDVVLPAGSFMTLPIVALQLDPALFPDPLTFNPDRFSEEKGQTIVKGSYMPFGSGPRICIGARFAKLEIQVALAKIILKYNIMKCDKTQVPLTRCKASFMNVPDKGIWLKIKPRTTAAA